MQTLDRLDTGLLAAAIAVLLYISNVALTLRGRRAGLAKDWRQAGLVPPSGAGAEGVKQLRAYLTGKMRGLTWAVRALVVPDGLLCVMIVLLLVRLIGDHTGARASRGLDLWIAFLAVLIAFVLVIYHAAEWAAAWGGADPEAAETRETGGGTGVTS